MDKIDYKILKGINGNARISMVKLARELHLSKDVVVYRIQKMREQQIIFGSRAVIALGKLGYQYDKFLLQFLPMSKEQELTWVNWMKKRSEVIWVGVCEGEWNAHATVRTRHILELMKFVDEFLAKFGQLLLRKELLRVLVSHRFNRKFLLGSVEEGQEWRHDFYSALEEVDKTDTILIRELSGDGEITFVELARKVRLTPEAVSMRVRALEKRGIILGYRVKIDYTKFGRQNYEVFLSVRDAVVRKKIIAYCQQHLMCETIMEFCGYYDLQLTFLLSNQREFKDVLAELRDRFGSGIMEYQALAAFQEFFTKPVN